jgi:lipopolysaccharide O-acetyltransferase
VQFKRSPLAVYGWVHLLWVSFCLVCTRIFFPACKLVRLPVFIRGRRNIVFGRKFSCGYFARLDAFGPPGCIRFGDCVELNDFVHIGALQEVTIGNNVLIASRVFISDHNHGIYADTADCSSPDEPPTSRVEPAKPVRIGDNVWIGEGVAVLAGVTIGSGAVIGANAVVTSDIPPDSVAVGIPARVVRVYDREAKVWKRPRP